MKNISLLILFTALVSNSLTLTMGSMIKSPKTNAEQKVFVLVENRLAISDEELQGIEDLETLPVQDGNTVKSLRDLQLLGLNNNQLTSVPTGLGNLTNLTVLGLDDNQLTNVPTQLGSLTNLQRLWLHNNQLTYIPPGLGNLTNLQRLWFQNNRLTSVPTELGSLTNVVILWLAHNRLESLPPALARLTKLKRINLMNNPFGRHESSIHDNVIVPSSVSFILFSLTGQKILRTAKQLIVDGVCPLSNGSKALKHEDLVMVQGQDLFNCLALIAKNLPTVESSIAELTQSGKADKTLQLLTTLRNYSKLYLWLWNLIISNKALIGNPIDSTTWNFKDEEANTSSRDVRGKILALMESHLINEAITSK